MNNNHKYINIRYSLNISFLQTNKVFFSFLNSRAKPRVSAVAGRRTYTEEELNSALQDILSGKLGTRRAAVLYGIPRSTLRNKVYKLALDPSKRESSQPATSVLDVLDQDDEDKDLSGGEDDKDFDKPLGRGILSAEDMIRLTSARSTMTAAALQKYGHLYEHNGPKTEYKEHSSQHHKAQTTPTPTNPQTPPIASNPWLDPVIFQNLLLAGGLMQQKYDEPAFQELFRNLLIQNQELMKEQMKNSASAPAEHLNNGKPSTPDARNIMQNLSLLQHQHQQMQGRLIKSDTPDSGAAGDPNDSEDSAVILKIPSFKAPSSSSGKNGDSTGDITPQTTPPLHSRSPQTHLPPGISPPVAMRHSNDSQSPPMGLGGKGIMSLREVIANSINRSFNQPQIDDQPSMDQYKRPSISVIKNLGGTDMTRFGTSPNSIINANVAQFGNSSNSNNANNSGGKGTRPKRGKYRNYDRDSLVEAVKAVQRGEMSVHRAGSYYGVPHSTLEYKVKERHLMRPRKREPKPQPLDGGSSSTSASIKAHDVSGPVGGNMRSMDKSKTLPTAKPPLKTPPFPATSPNGIKMGLFDPAHLQYPAHQLFWSPPPGYTGLPMDFARGAAGTPGSFPANAESFFASQMMQRFQEDALRQTSVGVSNANSAKAVATSLAAAATAVGSSSASGNASVNSSQAKSAREIAESLYDGTSANGSFLDGIIRHSLDRKAGESIPHGALLDQLVKNNRHSISDGDGSNSNNKRAGSPFTYNQHGIKRERNSTSSGETDRESVERDISKESVETLLKYRDGLSLRLDAAEEMNGVADHKFAHHTEAEDSS